MSKLILGFILGLIVSQLINLIPEDKKLYIAYPTPSPTVTYYCVEDFTEESE